MIHREMNNISKNKAKIITVVTPSYNQGDYIEETIQSVLSQVGEFYIDYIIMDGGSKDKTIDIIKRYEASLAKNCKLKTIDSLTYFVKREKGFKLNNCHGISFRWISEKDNGQVDALNKGFKMAKGQILAFLNSDDIYYPNTFNKLIHIDWNKADFVYGQGMWITETGMELINYPTFKPTPYNLFYQCTLCQPTVFFSRTVYQQMGEFSMEFPDTFDYEYWLRAAFAKKTFCFSNSFFAKSRMYDDNKSLSLRDSINKQIFLLKRKYFFHSSQKLIKQRLFLTQFCIQRKTVKQVNKLFNILGNNKRYTFWNKINTLKNL